jgi:hypothetical protein
MPVQDFDAYPAFFDVRGAPISQPPTVIIEPSHQLPSGSAIPYYPPDLPHLLNGLISYWKLDEASGTRADSVGTNNLAQSANVAGPPGLINQCAQFDGTQYLFIASNATLQVSGDFTFSGWIRLNVATDNVAIVSKWISTGYEYVLYNDPVKGFLFNVGNTSEAAVGSSPTAGLWYHLVGWYDSSDQKTRLRVNDTVTYVAPVTFSLVQGTTPFNIAGVNNVPTSGCFIDEIGFWKRLLTPAEITKLYNGGSGWPFANFTP